MSSKYAKWLQVLSILLALISMGQLMFTATLLFLISVILAKSGGYVATICGLIGSLICLPTAFKIRSHYGNKEEQKVRHYDIQTYHRCMLYISLGVQTFCALVCFACLTQSETCEVALTSSITKYQQKFSDKKFLDIVQVLFQCCGIYSHEDWAQKSWISATKQQIFCKHEYNDEAFKNIEMSPTAELNAKYLTAVPYSCCKIETSKPCRNFDLKCSGLKTINTNGCITQLNTFITSIVCSELIIYLFGIAVIVAMLKFFNWEETEMFLNEADDYSKLEGDDMEKPASPSSDMEPPKGRVYEEFIHRTRTTRVPKEAPEDKKDEIRTSKEKDRASASAKAKEEDKITSPKILSPKIVSPPRDKPSSMDTAATESKTDTTTAETKSAESAHPKPDDRKHEDKDKKHEGKHERSSDETKPHGGTRKSMKPPSDPSKTDAHPGKSIKSHADASHGKSIKPHDDTHKPDPASRKSMKPGANTRKSMKPPADPSKTDAHRGKSIKPPADPSKASRKSMMPHSDGKKSMKPPADSSKTDTKKSMKPHGDKDLRGGSDDSAKSVKQKRSRAGLSLFRRRKKKKKPEEVPLLSPEPSPAVTPVPSPLPTPVPTPVPTPSTSGSVTPSSSVAIMQTGSKSILKKRDPSSSSSSTDSRSNKVKFIDEVDFTVAHENTTAQLIPSKQEQIYITCDRQITLIPTCPTTVMTCQGVPVPPVCQVPQNAPVPQAKPPVAPPSSVCQKPICGNIQTQTDKTENPQIIQVNPPNIYICPPQNTPCPNAEPQQIYPTIESPERSKVPTPKPCGSFQSCASNMPQVCPGSAYKLPANVTPKSPSSSTTPILEKFTQNYSNYIANPITQPPDIEPLDLPSIELPKPNKKPSKKIEDYVTMPSDFVSKACGGKCQKPVIEKKAFCGLPNSSRCQSNRTSATSCMQPCNFDKLGRKVSFSTPRRTCHRSQRSPRRTYSQDSDSYSELLKKKSYKNDWGCMSDIERYYNFLSRPGVHINSPRSVGSWSTSSLDSLKKCSRRPCCSKESICRKQGACSRRRKEQSYKKSSKRYKYRESSSSSSTSSEDPYQNLSSFADLNRPRPKCCVDKNSCFVKQKCLSEEKCGTSRDTPIDLNLFPSTSKAIRMQSKGALPKMYQLRPMPKKT